MRYYRRVRGRRTPKCRSQIDLGRCVALARHGRDTKTMHCGKSEFDANARADIGRFKGLRELMPQQRKEAAIRSKGRWGESRGALCLSPTESRFRQPVTRTSGAPDPPDPVAAPEMRHLGPVWTRYRSILTAFLAPMPRPFSGRCAPPATAFRTELAIVEPRFEESVRSRPLWLLGFDSQILMRD